ncbi:hypothetical protein C5L39_09015 [Corynebacterium alimapuense]|uniref:Uncharacterized protein n=1 Tax=Corynebacterium alimapuense TaxID=1576874 RepID=A0A3M8K5V8_9CORY|nr:hypothetical protein C5L39_09015 [Corynebacterium alimapuense]
MPNVVTVLGVIVLALGGLMFSSTSLTALPATIAQLWLLLHLAPVNADGIAIGVLPMLPALGFVSLISYRIRVAVRERVSLPNLLLLVLFALLIPIALTLIATAMMWDASRVFDVGPPPIAEAVARTLLLHMSAVMIGMGSRLWRALARRFGAPGWLIDAAVSAMRILVAMSLVAVLALAVLLIFSWPRQVEVAGIYNSTGAVVAVSLLSLLYLPNAIIMTVAVLFGSGFQLGAASVSLFSIDLVALPPLPLLALIPGSVHDWAVLGLVPVVAITAIFASRVRLNLAQAVATGVFAAAFALLASYLTSGEIGELGESGPMLWLTAGMVFIWITGAGIISVVFGMFMQYRVAARERALAQAEADAAAVAADDSKEAEEAPEEEIIDGEVIAEDAEDAEDIEDTEELSDEEIAEEAPDGGEDSEAPADESPGQEEPEDSENSEEQQPDSQKPAATD